ncbi:DUF4097 family beta strand repeat-containing protein [Actinokineospora sp. NBRC 105648]|uniref:DUF4097 family beta strand repeat-containing protein n=1 Tax=Actinokineospora sp. NBRC 105648 TaxID=3032206 RepID=UPI0024A5FC12|nr:DUF4097 family beta strand repeat-containing protein [Actinokineospora sp. NBRC 105648]GLZ37525.1 lipoprotein [Actinokineospora sp. NBRC 105648]
MLGVSVAGVAVVASLVGACGLAPEKFTDDAGVGQTIRSVRVGTESGSVKIRTGSSTSVHRDVSYASTRPGPTHHVEGDVLVLGGCEVRNCWVDYEVVVPEGVSVSGDVDSGSVDVEGASTVNLRASSGRVAVRRASGAVNVVADSGSVDLVDVKGKVAVEASSGDVSVRDIGGDATLRAQSGTVEAQGVSGSTNAEASSGSITVRLAKVGGVHANADSGSVNVIVPKGDYRVTAHADSGDVDNAIGDHLDSPNHLDLAAGSGDITIRFG